MAELQHTLVTKEGLEKLQKELDELRTKTRGEVAQRLKEAKDVLRNWNSRSVRRKLLTAAKKGERAASM